jgi:hypothetical protein
MDFTERGLIRIEDKNNEGEVLGLAVALGENTLKEFGQAEVDTSPRDLDVEETVAAIHGLYRMSDINVVHPAVASLIRHEAGANGDLAFGEYGADAAHYLRQIALNGIEQSQPVS